MGLFEVAVIGRNEVKVSHLQFADDTIFMGTASASNARTMKRVLKNLELVSGLKINFNKCCIYGINVGEVKMQEMTGILNCEKGSLPFSYLGIKVGMNHRNVG